MDNKSNKMLIDATHPEETRVVVLKNGRVEEFDYESAARKILRGNIYLAKVTRVEPSLQAAFIDYGGNRHGFLAFAEIHPDYYQIPMADRQALLDEEFAAEAEADAEADARAERSEARDRDRSRRGGRDGGRDDQADHADQSGDHDDTDGPSDRDQNAEASHADDQRDAAPGHDHSHDHGHDHNHDHDHRDEASAQAERTGFDQAHDRLSEPAPIDAISHDDRVREDNAARGQWARRTCARR